MGHTRTRADLWRLCALNALTGALALAVVAWSMALVTVTPAQADMRLRGGEFWVVVASRSTPEPAITIAQQVEEFLTPTMVVRSNNGLYAVVAGYFEAEKAVSNLETLKDLRLLPPDAFLTAGERFQTYVWPNRPQVNDLIRSPTLRNTVVFMQSRLQTLGYYTAEIDGLVGAGLRKALKTFEAAHGRAGHRVQGWNAAQVLAAIAAQSDPEMMEARAEEREAMEARARQQAQERKQAALEQKALSAGYRSVQEMDHASAKGFKDAAEYQKALEADFTSAAAFRNAREAGFRDRSEVEAAQKAGYKEASAYRAFARSGFDDPLVYETARQQGYNSKTSAIAGRRRALVRLRDKTRILMEDAALFVRMRPDPDRALAIADRIAALTIAFDKEVGDSFKDLSAAHDNLKERADNLAAYLAGTPAFKNFRAEQEAARNAATKASIQKVRTSLADLDRGMKAWVVQNLLDQHLPAVTQLLDRLEQNRSTSDLSALRALKEKTEEGLKEAGILTDIHRLGTPPAQTEAAKVAASQNASGVTATFTPTAATRFLLTGPDDDIVLVYNAKQAPHIVRDLAGKLRFQGGEAQLCLVGGKLPSVSERVLRQVFSQLERPAKLDLSNSCNGNELDGFDLVAFQRSTFLSGDKAFAQTLVEAVENGRWRQYEDVTGSELKAASRAESALVETLDAELAAGSGDGFAAIVMAAIGSDEDRDLCLVGETGLRDTDFHNEQLDNATAALAIPVASNRTPMTAEDSFIATQRGRCRLLYAPIADLSMLAKALKNDQRAFSVAPLRVTLAELESYRTAQEAAVSEARKRGSAQAAEEEEERARKAREAEREEQAARLEAERKLAQTQRMQAEASAAARTEKLRAQYRSRATARRDTIRDLARNLFDEDRPASNILPALAGFVSNQHANAWTHEDLDVAINDYGVADWEGREIDAAVIRLEPAMVNAELGRKETPCFLVAALFDDEFSRLRAVREMTCEDADLEPWLSAHDFESRWTATPAE